ncbi:MAG: DEAD/DEAH box helicase, partial [Candidatus Poribacteria bacterium]|nr:DEAD/DEAH box helicase [Candidatus Poribacteria bacterium]
MNNEAATQRAELLAKTLYPHQVEGIAFLLGRRRSLLADDMGLGKTRQSIVAMVEAEPTGPYLVICPASVKRNWVREIEVVLPHAATHIVGPADLPSPDFDGWIVMNYDILGKHLSALRQVGWKGFVFDEAHYLKNYQSQRSRHATQLSRGTDADPVVHALTGTPLTSRPRDLFPLLQLLDHPLGRSFRSFAKRYCDGYQGEYGYVADGASNLDELTVQLHGVMLRRTKDETLDLPPKMRTWLDVEIHPKAVEHLNAAIRDLATLSRRNRKREDDTPETRRAAGQLLGRLTTTRRKLAALKAKDTIGVIGNALEQGEKVIVFSAFAPPIERFMRHFGEQAVSITGETPVHDRQTCVDRFQTDDNVRVFVANLHLGGVGLNLTAARQVVFNDLDWVPANHWQAEDRAYRIGQTGTVNVTYMVGTGTVDEFVKSVLEIKADLVDQLIEGKALAETMETDVLGELRRMLGYLSDRFERVPVDGETVVSALRDASKNYA